MAENPKSVHSSEKPECSNLSHGPVRTFYTCRHARGFDRLAVEAVVREVDTLWGMGYRALAYEAPSK